MKHRLFWKLFVLIAVGVVVLIALVDLAMNNAEDGMSKLSEASRVELLQWRHTAESLLNSRDFVALDNWLSQLQQNEDTWAAVASTTITHISGGTTNEVPVHGQNLGRNIDWNIHLYFSENPIMELPFVDQPASLLIKLPARMRPGSYWLHTRLFLKIAVPFLILLGLCVLVYQHIMNPLRTLQRATRDFSNGNLAARVGTKIGQRNDELTALAENFDDMAERISELIHSQRQLIADLSHELRTPLSRLDIAVDSLLLDSNKPEKQARRIARESEQLRRLVEDTLALAWLDNERPHLPCEEVELVDLIDVLARDARYEFPDRSLHCSMPDTLKLVRSNHRALGQAIENILRNAMRHTPPGQNVRIDLQEFATFCQIEIKDHGPGIDASLLELIFKPFFRVESGRPDSGKSFGLGLALAKRYLAAVGAKVTACNQITSQGLVMTIKIPFDTSELRGA